MNEPIFELKDVHYSYLGRHPALCGIDLMIRRNEKIAIIGANGTGKSTLLHLLDGLIFPDRGSVVAFGEELSESSLSDADKAKGFRSRVGFVFQNADVQLFCPSVRDDIVFGPVQLGVDANDIKKRLAEIAQALGVQHLLDRIPHQLSIGEKKKVAIASVLAINPEVLIFDEPTAGLDPLTVRHIVDLIVDAHRGGKTIIVATHDLHIVEELADTVYVFDRNKKIGRKGTPEAILTDHEFLQANNLLHIHGHTHKGKIHVHPHSHSHGDHQRVLDI